MTATQTQIRRDTAANLEASTPALAELGYDITNKRIIAGDGSTLGGIKIPNYLDTQNNVFSYASAGGSANAITLPLAVSPGAYADGLGIRFKAAATNTTGVTINVNGLGAKNLYKFTGGVLGAVAAGDIVNGGIYDVIYDGTQFQLLTYQNSGLLTVRQGDLATATGSVSHTGLSGANLILPGGEYGFYPTLARTGGGTSTYDSRFRRDAVGVSAFSAQSFIWLAADGTAVANQRYITSSPPFDLGDGEAGGFMFAEVDAAGEIVSHYLADVPPWAYNGPTKIRADHICPITGKKFRKTMKKRTFEEIMDGASIECDLEEITQAIKNADMDLIPHPFGQPAAGNSIILLDPCDDRIKRMIELQNAGGSEEIIEQIRKGFLKVDNEKMAKRKCPKGVAMHRMKFKYTGKAK